MSNLTIIACTGILALTLGIALTPDNANAQQVTPGIGANVSSAPKDGGLLRQPVGRCIFFQGETRAKCESQDRRSPQQRTQRGGRR